MPAIVVDPQRPRLLAQIRVLAPRHAVDVNLGGPRTNVALESDIAAAHLFPIIGNGPHCVRIETGIARTEPQGFDDGPQIGLGGQSGHGVDGAVHGVDAGLDGCEYAGRGDPASVVRVEMNGQTHFLLERLDERGGGTRLAQPSHVLDREHVSAHRLELHGRFHVVLQVVLGLPGIREIPRVADRGLAQAARVRARPRLPPACCRPNSGNRTPGTHRCPHRPPSLRNASRRCRDNWRIRPRSPIETASAAAGWASLRGRRRVAPRDPPSRSAMRRRKSRRPSIPPRNSCGSMPA